MQLPRPSEGKGRHTHSSPGLRAPRGSPHVQRRPTQQALLEDCAELLLRQEGTQLPEASGRGDASVVLIEQRRD